MVARQQTNVQGGSPDETARRLFDSGVTIVEAIKIIMRTYHLSLGQAKTIVTACDAWQPVVRASKPLHDDLEKIINAGAK